MAKKTGSKPMTKTEIMRAISETTGLPKKDVVAVVESLTEEIGNALKKSGIGVFCGCSRAAMHDQILYARFP